MGDVFQAARATDPIGHGWGMVGLLAGVVVGAAIVAAGVVTGGAAIALVIAAGALSGAALANGIQKVIGSKNPWTGNLGIGSLNVRFNGLGAARVVLDSAVPICNGLYGANHFPFLPKPPIAEGCKTIRINGQLAARVQHKLVCAADITDGSPNVWLGGPTEQVLPIIDTEKILTIAAMIVVGIATIEISGPLLGAAYLTGGFAFSEGVNYFADKYLGPGWGDIINGTLGFLALGLGAYKGRAIPEESSLEDGVKRGTPEEITERQALENITRDREAITRLSDAGDIEGARQILEPFAKAGDAQGIIDRLDVSSPKDGAVFWSGDKTAAGEFARQRGGVTLETTSGGKVVDDWGTLNDNLPWDNGGKEFWGNLSDKYSRGASGEVNVVQTAEKAAQGGGYTWKNVEQPVLEKLQEQGVVTDINTHVLPPK